MAVLLSTAAPRPVAAELAEGGSGLYKSQIDWFEWGAHGEPVPSGSSQTNIRMVGDQELATTCTVSDVVGGVSAFRPGTFGADGLDDLYNVGGTGAGNTLVSGLANTVLNGTATFDISCSATLAGTPVPLAGLVMAEAETSSATGDEYVEARPGEPATWRIIDRLREGCTTSTEAILSADGTLRLAPDGPHCPTGPMAVAFMDGATSAAVELKGGGVSAVAFGVVLGVDFGDAPAGYGEAGAILSPTWQGGAVPEGTTKISDDSFALGTPEQPATRLGAAVDADAVQAPSADASADGADDDAVGAIPVIETAPGEQYVLTDVVCEGPGFVAGWIDWNGNEAFDANERSNTVECADGSVDLAWTVPLGTVDAVGADRTFLRLRIAGDVADVATPTGLTTSGEVEDHAVQVDVPLPVPAICSPEEDRATQRYWFFGANGAIDFGTTGTTATQFLGKQTTVEGSTVVTDTAGNLVFWSNGQQAFDRNSDVMPNGSGLLGNHSATQTVAAFPSLGNPGIYFIVTTSTDVGTAANGQLTYSVVDMSLNNGLGDVTATKNVALGAPGTASEAITAVPNATGDGFWVLTYTNNSPNILAYEFDADGPVTGTPVTSVMPTSNFDFYGSLAFNADYTRLVQMTAQRVGDATVRVLQFNAATGEIAEELRWALPTGAGTGSTGYNAEFSPEGDYVYATKIFNTGRLYRYNVAGASTGAEVKATEQYLGAIGTNGGQVRRAPDGRMYVANRGGTSLSLVSTPDAASAGFSAGGFPLLPGSSSHFGLPQTVVGCPIPDPVDFGDAPVGYGTRLADGGASHSVPAYDETTQTAPLMLGNRIDVEADGAPTDDATGDDTSAVPDEDGVAGPIVATEGKWTTVPVTVTNNTSVVATLAGWADLNADGDFDAEELTRTTIPADSGTTVHHLSFPPTAACEVARFRLFSGDVASPSPTGAATGGEVEDYQVLVEPACSNDDVQVLLEGSAQAWTPGSTWQSNTFPPRLALNAPDGEGTQLYSLPGNVLTLDLSTVVPSGEVATLHLAAVGTAYRGDVRVESSVDGVDFGSPTIFDVTSIVPTYEQFTYVVPPEGARYIRITPLAGDGSHTAIRVDAVTYAFEYCECADATNYVQQPSFEEFPSCSTQTGPFGAWSPIQNNIHIYGPTCGRGWPAADGIDTVDLDGTTTGGIQQTITGLIPGNTYNLRWSQAFNPAAGAASASARVRIGDFDETYTSASNASSGGFNEVRVEFTALSDTEVLRFESLTGSNDPTLLSNGGEPGFGVVIDDVRLSPMDCSEVRDFDYGDAPDDYGTTSVEGGPAHGLPGYDPVTHTAPLMIGASVDAEDDGQPTPAADGDAAGVDDEDGVSPIVSVLGDPLVVPVTVTNSTTEPATLAGWVDLDGDEIFEPGEVQLASVPAGTTATAFDLTFPTPTTTTGTFARFRLFPGALAAADVLPVGPAAAGEVEDHPVAVTERSLVVTKTSDFDDARPGDVVEYTVTLENTGTADYTPASPAVLKDSLSGLLDDADYNLDVSADRGPLPGFSAETITWSGPLPAGETVTLTYSTTITGGGDGSLPNVAWVPADPDNPTPPACDPVTGDGTDSVTGEPCARVLDLLPKLTVTKTADTTAIPADNGVVTYTVVAENTGPGHYTTTNPAIVTDDLTDVLDDAAFGDASADRGADPVLDGTMLEWSGALTSGDQVIITYTVTYDADAAGGDNRLRNEVCVGESEATAGTSPCDLVEIPGADLTQWKQVVPSQTPSVAGSTLTYTLFFQNDGATDAAVDSRDDLTDVLDDTSFTTDPNSPDGLTLDLQGSLLDITGTVPPGETYRVSYVVALNADGQRPNNVANNFLLEAEPGGGFPETPAECDPEDPQFPTCTSTPFPEIVYAKSWSVDDATLGEGSIVSYTIEVHNIGETEGAVYKADDLSGALDDADVVSAPQSDTPSVSASGIVDDAFTISGTLPADGIAEITYRLRVKAQAERNDDVIQNFLVDDPTLPPPTECEPTTQQCTETFLPRIDVAKSVDVAPGTPVMAGDRLEYTLRFENTGSADGAVEYTDLLADVVDDAVVDGVEVVSGPLATQRVDDTVEITGQLGPSEVSVIRYFATVRPDGERDDNRLGNFVVPTGTEPPEECEPGDQTCTEHGIGEIVSWKTVSASTTPVEAGTVLTYTVLFENIGEGPGSVAKLDDLTHVLDDGDVTFEPASTQLTATRTGPVIEMSGPLAAKDTAAVGYQVTLREDGDRGDDIAANFLLDPGEDPPEGPECVPSDDQLPDCTSTGIGHLVVTKAVEASTDPVQTGTELSYTLTFDNVGGGAVTVDKVDDLTDVLDDSRIADLPDASDPALDVSFADDTITVTGSLTAGQVVTVTYSVTVNPEDDRGDDSIVNFVLDPDEEPPTSCDPAAETCTETLLPRVLISKEVEASSDPVETGTVLSYTLTFDNAGRAAGPVEKVDDLTGVLDDADLTSGPAVSDPDALVVSRVDDSLSVTGALEPGEVETVTYAVTIREEGQRGDDVAVNFLLDPGEEPPLECDPEVTICTVTLMPEILDRKEVAPASGTPVVAGDELTYTLTFTNAGTAAGPVDRVDDLTHVLDDADLVSAVESSSAALTATGPDAADRIAITGILDPDETVTVRYTVRVRESGERGDDVIGNALLDPVDPPPPGPECEPEVGLAAAGDPDCTSNPIGDIRPSKAVDPPRGTSVEQGAVLTYTLRFENVGRGAAEIDYVDHLAAVLDDADLTTEPTATNGAVVTGPTDDRLHIGGTVRAGETATVTYQVTVREFEAQGDHRLGNFLTVAGFDPPTLCDPADPLCTDNPIAPPDLSVTGVTLSITAVLLGGLALLMGSLLVGANRRRLEQTEV